MGGGQITEPRAMPYIEWQNVSTADRPVGRFQAIALNVNASTHTGWWVDVRGFHGIRARLSVTGGTTGTISIHAHLVKNGEGIHNSAMPLVLTTTGVAGIPDFSTLVAGTAPGGSPARSLPVSAAASDTYGGSHKGIPVHGINNEDLSLITSVENHYSPISVDDEARPFVLLSHNSGLT